MTLLWICIILTRISNLGTELYYWFVSWINMCQGWDSARSQSVLSCLHLQPTTFNGAQRTFTGRHPEPEQWAISPFLISSICPAASLSGNVSRPHPRDPMDPPVHSPGQTGSTEAENLCSSARPDRAESGKYWVLWAVRQIYSQRGWGEWEDPGDQLTVRPVDIKILILPGWAGQFSRLRCGYCARCEKGGVTVKTTCQYWREGRRQSKYWTRSTSDTQSSSSYFNISRSVCTE